MGTRSENYYYDQARLHRARKAAEEQSDTQSDKEEEGTIWDSIVARFRERDQRHVAEAEVDFISSTPTARNRARSASFLSAGSRASSAATGTPRGSRERVQLFLQKVRPSSWLQRTVTRAGLSPSASSSSSRPSGSSRSSGTGRGATDLGREEVSGSQASSIGTQVSSFSSPLPNATTEEDAGQHDRRVAFTSSEDSRDAEAFSFSGPLVEHRNSSFKEASGGKSSQKRHFSAEASVRHHVEGYFKDQNTGVGALLAEEMDDHGFVDLRLLAAMRGIRRVARASDCYSLLQLALRPSYDVELSMDGTMVRRRPEESRQTYRQYSIDRSVLVWDMPREWPDVDSIGHYFSQFGLVLKAEVIDADTIDHPLVPTLERTDAKTDMRGEEEDEARVTTSSEASSGLSLPVSADHEEESLYSPSAVLAVVEFDTASAALTAICACLTAPKLNPKSQRQQIQPPKVAPLRLRHLPALSAPSEEKKEEEGSSS